MKKITLADDSYWKLLEIKTKMRCQTWKELIDKLYIESERRTRLMSTPRKG